MSEWNGEVGDIVKPAEKYDVENKDKIGFNGGKEAGSEDVVLYGDAEMVLLDVGDVECIARLTYHSYWVHPGSHNDFKSRENEGLVFRIPTKVLIGWQNKREERKKADELYELARAESDKQNELDRARWC